MAAKGWSRPLGWLLELVWPDVKGREAAAEQPAVPLGDTGAEHGLISRRLVVRKGALGLLPFSLRELCRAVR